MKIDSYLPLFPGFYGSIFEADEEGSIEDGKTYDDYEWDYKDYMERVGMECCHAVESQLKEFDIKIKYQHVNSPKYYNYSNDSINVKYTITKKSFKLLLDYLSNNLLEFEQYLKENYTCRDGFISLHSNDTKDWILQSENLEKPEHKFGAILEFYLENEDYKEFDLYEDVASETSWVHGTLIKKDESNE
jgi:hypothetical protein